jgi:hypothetical protein
MMKEIRIIGNEKSGDILLQISGEWPSRRNPRAIEFFQSVEKMPIYGLKSPNVEGRLVRIFVAAEELQIRKFMEGLGRAKVPFKVVRLGRLRAKGESLIENMTLQQMRILRLVHTLGYYDIPRRIGTAELASVLGMDKGTVGEHLRRAEKHAFDDFLGP